jgi:hypothetical protein
VNKNKKHRRPHHRAKLATLANFRRIDKKKPRPRPTGPRRELTAAEKFRIDATVGFMFDAARKIFGPMFERIGKQIAENAEPVEWPEELEVDKDAS